MTDASKCRKCGGEMKPGTATGQTYTSGMPDFGPDDEISTMSAGGPGALVPAMKCRECGWSVTPVPCKIRGIEYPSISAAARALKLSRQAVQDGLNRGTPDTIGLGRNWWHKKPQANKEIK